MALSLIGGLSPALAAEPPSGEALVQMSPQQRAQALGALHSRTQVRRTLAQVGSTLDVTPPQLLALTVGTRTNADSATGRLPVRLTVSDDLSGLDSLGLCITSPSGGQQRCNLVDQLGGVRQWEVVTGLEVPPYSEAGVWQLSSVWMRDVQGNYGVADAAALAALGNTAFTVSSQTPDLQAPSLVSGRLLTTQVQLSRPATGTADHGPWVRLQVQATDAGPAGLRSAYANFCQADGVHCFSMSSGWSDAQGQRTGKFLVSTTLAADQAPGEYLLYAVGLSDQGNNWVDYRSQAFPYGTVDFSAWFPVTTLTVKP